jgi:ribonuclease HI
MPRIIVYTDGACSKNGAKHAQASWATWFPSHPDWSSAERVPGDVQTNNRGELCAILEAYRRIKQELGSGCEAMEIAVYTDSEYSKNCLTIWTAGWIRKGWITAGGTPVMNRDLIQQVLDLQPQFKSTTYYYVRAHTGGTDEHSIHNDRVDRMARRVLDESVTLPTLETQDTSGCPLRLLGPPVSKTVLASWVKENMKILDSDALEKALLKALAETFSNQGSKMEIRKGMVTLTAGLQIESAKVDKDD